MTKREHRIEEKQRRRSELLAAVTALVGLLKGGRKSAKFTKMFELLLVALVRKKVTPAEVRKLVIAIRKKKIPDVSLMAGSDSLVQGWMTAEDFVASMLNLTKPPEPWRAVTVDQIIREFGR